MTDFDVEDTGTVRVLTARLERSMKKADKLKRKNKKLEKRVGELETIVNFEEDE